jgi:hypothetical protein
MHEDPKTWKKWLPLAELWYNSMYHSTLGCFPFKADYGTKTIFLFVPTLDTPTDMGAIEMLQERQAQLTKLNHGRDSRWLTVKIEFLARIII